MSAMRARTPVFAWTLTVLSCLLAGMAIFAVRPAPPIASGNVATAASRAAVLGFYEAVNAVIATGDAAPLAAVLAPDYAEPDAAGRLVPGRAALEERLHTLHGIASNLRLDAADLVGDGDRVAAVVATRGAEQVTPLGLPLIAPVLWGPVDVFRVANGRIAARDGARGPGLVLERRVQAPLDLPLTSAQAPTIRRATVAPEASLSLPAVEGPRLLSLETGALVVAIADSVPRGDDTTLTAGNFLVLSTGLPYVVRNAEREPAVLLEVLVTTTNSPTNVAANRIEGASMRLLAGGLLTPGPAGQVVLTTGRLTLDRGDRLAWEGPAGPTMLVVEEGTLELATKGAPAWVHLAVDRTSESRILTTLATGDGARIGMGTGAEVRNVGDTPVDVLVVTLLAAAEEPGKSH